MSNPAQSAVGAETMTAGEVEALAKRLHEANPGAPLLAWDGLWEPMRENYRAMARAALASPRADSDERTAEDDWAATLARSILSREGYAYTHLVEAVATELRRIEAVGYTRGHEAGDAHRKAATPAQPAGAVPDSLQEVPEGAIHNGREHLRRLGLYGFTANDGHALDHCEDYIGAQQCFEVMAEVLASHPAGQSAGSGAEARPVAWLLEKPDGETHLTECRPRDDWKDGTVTPLYARQERPRTVEFMCEGQVCTAEVPTPRPAPDSTRTGQGEVAETVASLIINNREKAQQAISTPALWGWFCGQIAASGVSYELGKAHLYALLDALAARPAAPEAQGVETDVLVDRFAAALKAKLRAAEAKYGWQNGWLKNDWAADCQRDLARHVGKGDPLDVAAYAAFCWHHGWSTSSDSPRTRCEETEYGWLRKAADEIDKIADLWSGDGRAYGKTLAAVFRADADRQGMAASAKGGEQ